MTTPSRVFAWLDRTSDRLCDKPWWRDWMDHPFAWAQRASCVVFGHVPIAECHDPEHDSCAYCRASTPNQGPRGEQS